MELKSIGFIGGGRITKIILQALANRHIDLSPITVCDTNTEVLKSLGERFPGIQTTDSCSQAAQQEIVVIALHPPAIMDTLEQIKGSVTENTQVLSFAPKISIEKIVSTLASKKVARMIPNATSLINEGYNPVSFSAGYPEAEKQSLSGMLEVAGKTFEVEEPKLEAYAIVSAMLPTYFWFQWKEMEDLGIQMGLDEPESKETVRETLQAAIDLFYGADLSYNEVIDLIPVKPIGEHEDQISEIYRNKLMGLYQKIKP